MLQSTQELIDRHRELYERLPDLRTHADMAEIAEELDKRGVYVEMSQSNFTGQHEVVWRRKVTGDLVRMYTTYGPPPSDAAYLRRSMRKYDRNKWIRERENMRRKRNIVPDDYDLPDGAEWIVRIEPDESPMLDFFGYFDNTWDPDALDHWRKQGYIEGHRTYGECRYFHPKTDLRKEAAMFNNLGYSKQVSYEMAVDNIQQEYDLVRTYGETWMDNIVLVSLQINGHEVASDVIGGVSDHDSGFMDDIIAELKAECIAQLPGAVEKAQDVLAVLEEMTKQ